MRIGAGHAYCNHFLANLAQSAVLGNIICVAFEMAVNEHAVLTQ